MVRCANGEPSRLVGEALLDRGGLLRRLRRLGRLLRVIRAPVRLRVDVDGTQTATAAPRAADRARAATEVRYDPAGAAAGHTLPRLMSALGQILAVGVIACHEAMRLAFPA
jgi:hypothetical protein